MHHRAGQRAVGARPRRQMQIRDGGGRRSIRIDHDEFRAPFLPRPGYVRHDVDLGRNRVAAPHHDQIRLRHLARIDAAALSDAGLPADFRQRGADRHLLPRIPHDIAQPVDAVALQQAHGAGEVKRPYRLGAMLRGDVGERAGDAVQCLVPRDTLELRRTLRPGAQQRMGQTVGVMNALGITADLGADHARRVTVVLRAAHGADAGAVQHLHRQSTGGGAIVRANRGPDLAGHVHAPNLSHRRACWQNGSHRLVGDWR